jgi:uncharacterized protein
MKRSDYAFPFRIDGASRRGAAAPSYEAHVEQMIRQVLLTSPGERANLPAFGCGVRRLLFAPISEALTATAQILVSQSLTKWLGGHIEVRKVEVLPPGASPEESQILVRIEYVLLATRSDRRVEVLVA